jgi:hypothetical protein
MACLTSAPAFRLGVLSIAIGIIGRVSMPTLRPRDEPD